MPGASASDVPSRTEWEGTRASEPMDFPAIMFGVLTKVFESALGSKERHRRLQDLESLLHAHIAIDASKNGTQYIEAKKRASSARDQIAKGKIRGIDPKEATDFFQKKWLEALIDVLKRRGLLGEDWTRE